MLGWVGDLIAYELGHLTADLSRGGQPPVESLHVPHTRWGRLAVVALGAGAVGAALEKSVGFGAMIAAPLLLLIVLGWRWSRSLQQHRRPVREAPATIREQPSNDR
jgi:hypothetical protein